MKFKIRTADLGDGVVYCIGYSPTLTLLVVNSRPVTELNVEHAREAAATVPAQRAPVVPAALT